MYILNKKVYRGESLRVMRSGAFPRIGMRIIKSAVGVLICFLIYLIRGKQGAPFYSALAVLWCIQNQTKNTVGNALQRTVGTLIGAVYGLLYLLFKLNLFQTGSGILHYFVISALLIPIIYTTVLIRQKKASYFSCVVFLSIVVNHLTDENPYMFVLNRCFDTLIGILVGLIINSIRIHGRKADKDLFIVDIDKSMDRNKGGVSPYGLVSIQNMLESGIKLSFMTKRTPAGFLEAMPCVKLQLPIIAMDGAILYDISENRYPKVYVISATHAGRVEDFIFERGFNLFTTVILEDVLIIYYKDLKNLAEKDIYEKMHKSPYRNYLHKERPSQHPVVYMMCIDKTERIEALISELVEAGMDQDLKFLSYPSDDYKGYSYLKIYNQNASVENMVDYMKENYGINKVVSLSDNKRIKVDYLLEDSNKIIHKLSNLYYWDRSKRKGA